MLSLTIDDVTPVRGLLRRLKVRVDPSFRGELRRLRSDASVRKSFFSQRGLLVDDVGEALHDAGFTDRRQSPREVIDILADILPAGAPERELCGVPLRIAEVLLDGRQRTIKEIQRALRFETDHCICRDIRRLRGKTYKSLTVPVRKVRGRWYYRLTPQDVEKVRALLPREEEVAI